MLLIYIGRPEIRETLQNRERFIVRVLQPSIMSGPPEMKVGFSKDKWRRMKSTSEDGPKTDEDIIRAVLAKFHVPKKVTIQSPYVPPPEQELFEHTGRSTRQLHQVIFQLLLYYRDIRRMPGYHMNRIYLLVSWGSEFGI